MINELSALRRIEERFHKTSDDVLLGIGDDTAAVRFKTGNLVLATTDSQVEGVHFVKTHISPSDLARKAVAVSVSDIGAMGGIPKFILASVGFSDEEDENFLDALILGFSKAEEEFGVELVGGNLSSSDMLFIDITVLGEVEPDLIVKRSTAIAGESIYVSGTLGDSALGLKLLQGSEEVTNAAPLTRKHLHPSPRLELGRQLALYRLAGSMIDISDGFLLDLERITANYCKGATIDITKIPTSKEYDEWVGYFYDNIYEPALSGGEDYELLFTSNTENRDKIQKLSDKLKIKITEIGEITTSKTIEILNSRDEINLKQRGFVHFNG